MPHTVTSDLEFVETTRITVHGKERSIDIMKEPGEAWDGTGYRVMGAFYDGISEARAAARQVLSTGRLYRKGKLVCEIPAWMGLM